MKARHLRWVRLGALAPGLLLVGTTLPSPAHARQKRPVLPASPGGAAQISWTFFFDPEG